jgi:PAS domain S-box-containing protein
MDRNPRDKAVPVGELEELRARIADLERDKARSAACEEKLRREAGLQAMLLEASPAYFVAIDRSGCIARMNSALLEALGYTWKELRGRNYAEAVLSEYGRRRYSDTRDRIVGCGMPVCSENTLLTKDGRTLIVEWHGRPVVNTEGEVEYFFGVGIDITEHRKAEEELRSRSLSAQAYLDLAGVIFLSLDREGNVSLINQKGCDVLGGTQEEILGLNWFDTFVPERNKQQIREVFEGLATSDPIAGASEYENPIVTLHGERRVIEWHNASIYDESGRFEGTMSSGIDITERKRAEDVQRLAYNIGSAVHAAGSVQELFDRIRDALGAVMNTENFFIALYNKEKDTLSLSYFRDERDQDDFDSFPAGKTLTGYLIKHDTSLLVDREELDRWVEQGIVDMVGSPSLIWLGVPLRVSGEVIGALVVQSYTDRNEFGESDKEVLEFVSEQIGFAIEHKRAEDELQASEAKNRAILDALPDIIFRMDRSGVFLSYDAAGDDDLAAPPEAFLGSNIIDIFPREFAERVLASIERIFQTSEMQVIEYTIPVPLPDGELRDFEARMVLGADRTILAVVRDITESKRADRLLRTLNDAALAMEQKMGLDEVFEAAASELSDVGMTGAIFLMDDDGETLRLEYTSRSPEQLRAARKLLGINLSEVPCRVDDVDVLRKAVRERTAVFCDNMQEFLRQKLPVAKKKFAPQLERTLNTRRAILAPMSAEDRVFGLLAVSSDELTEREKPAITAFANQLAAAWRKATLMQELQHSIQELSETQDQLLQAQKMEAVGRLAGGVAHDFNNLLTAISGYAELLACDASLGEKTQSDVAQIRRAADQAAALTKQLLAFSRRQPLQPVAIDLNRVVSDMNAMLRRLIGEDIVLETALDESACQTKVDPGQVEQVIINLVVNARDAMPEGGRLTITTHNVTLDSLACATIHDARPGRFACISIEDTGSGIERDVIDQIFEPFFSTKGPTKGTGLGLAVVYGIIRQHGGWINVYSEPGQGTAFKVYLPSVSPEARQDDGDAVDAIAPATHGVGQRILLVEDEDAVRELAARALTEGGYVVFEAAAADEALEIFEREGGRFDLVFSDVVLPDRSGIRLIEDLLGLRPDLQVLVSSGYTDQKSQWPVIQEKGYRFLQKPYSLVDLLGTVDELV